jgi:hypothetical protein
VRLPEKTGQIRQVRQHYYLSINFNKSLRNKKQKLEKDQK